MVYIKVSRDLHIKGERYYFSSARGNSVVQGWHRKELFLASTPMGNSVVPSTRHFRSETLLISC